MRDIWACWCRPTPRRVRCRMAQLLCQLLSFVSTHLTLVAAPVSPIPLWRAGWEDRGWRRCVSPGVLWLREAVMPITAPACPPITHTDRPTLRQGHWKQANKTTIDNNLKTRLSFSSETFPLQLLKQRINTRQALPKKSPSRTLVFSLLREITHFQPFRRESEACADWGDRHSTRWRVAAWLGWARCGVSFSGRLLLNIKRNRWRLHRGREACGIEELLRSVWTHFLFWAVAPSLSPLRHLPHSRPWQLDTLTAAAEWQLICTNFKPYKSTCHNKSIKELGPSR